jgi:two-component system sporulation sensor kinase A
MMHDSKTKDTLVHEKIGENSLKQSEELFRTVIEAAPSLLVITDKDGNNVYVSPNCKQITGYTQEELLGKVIWWVHKEDAERAKNVFSHTYREGIEESNFEYRAIKKDGKVWFASSSWKMLRDEKGAITGAVIQTSDITKHKELEAKLIEQDKLASLGRIAAMVAHDLNTPLANIFLSAELLLSQKSEGLYQQEVQTIKEEASHASDIVNRILNFSRKDKLKVRKVDLKKILADAIECVNKLCGAHYVSIKTHISSSSFLGDEHRLREAFINIIKNAVEAADNQKDEPHIKVRTEEKDNLIIVTIEDNGKGIKKSIIDDISKPFFTTKSSGEGIGLGLTIAQLIIKQHEGTLSIDGIENKGTIVKVILPNKVA